MQVTITGVRDFPCTQALGPYLRVKPDPTYGLALAGAGDEELGTTQWAFVIVGLGSATNCPVVLPTSQGTIKMVANGPIAALADVYAAADGKVAASGTIRLGKAMSAAGADGDYLEVLRYQSTETTDTGTTASTFTVDSDGTYPIIALASQTGGTGQFTLTLKPAATLTAARSVLVPDADDTLVNLASLQTLTGKTLTTPVLTLPRVAADNTPVAATGTDKTDCAAIGAQDLVTVSSNGAGKGVQLLTGVAGQVITLINTTGTACLLYPHSGGTLSGLAADAPVTVGGSHIVKCYCVAPDTWYVEDCGAILAA
ncbi:MAG: hypothetical protein ACLQLG_18630 [Thermoguttaceae bacterium]